MTSTPQRPLPVQPFTPYPYSGRPLEFGAGDEAKAIENCALLEAREKSDMAWFRAAVLTTGGTSDMLRMDLSALSSLWEWVVQQLDADTPFVPEGWHGEWRNASAPTELLRRVARLTFLGQALAFHIADLLRVERPHLRWTPYKPRLGNRDPHFLFPTLADEHFQLVSPLLMTQSLLNASPLLEIMEPRFSTNREPGHLVSSLHSFLDEGEPVKPARSRRGPAQTPAGAPGLVAVQPHATRDENPQELFLYRAKRTADGADPARCRPIDTQRLVAGLTGIGFEPLTPDEPPYLSAGTYDSEWILDRPDGTAIAYVLLQQTPARRGSSTLVSRRLEIRIEPEADDGMTPDERARGLWWHAGLLTRLRQLAANLGAAVVTRQELEESPE